MIPILEQAHYDITKNKVQPKYNLRLKPRPSDCLLDLLLWPQLQETKTELLALCT